MTMPVIIHVTRTRGDTFAERFRIPDEDVTGATFSLTVESLASLTGSIVTASSTYSDIDFPVTDNAVASASAATYDYGIVMTSGGRTRTIVTGRWTVEARTFE